jgi:hypothetical protein
MIARRGFVAGLGLLRAAPAVIRTLDGRADIWVNLGNAELPPSVQLDIDDEAIAFYGNNILDSVGA